MEVRAGYKRTEVGVIPEEWEAGVLACAVEKLEAGTSVNSEMEETPDFDSYPCVLKTGAAKGGALNPDECKKVARRDLWRLKLALRKDTILISRMNTVELVGESGYVDADHPNLFVPDRLWMATLRSTVHPRWLSYVLTWQPVKSQISASATGTSGSMKNVSKPSLRAVKTPYPPVDEQRAIAAALSDVDALLGGLDRLIAKKRDLKQAAMQQLLTGQTRLPGFHAKDGFQKSSVGQIPEDWKCLGVPQVVSGNSNSIKIGPFGSSLKKEFLVATGYKVYGQENLYARDMAVGVRYINHSRFMELRACEIRPGDFLISMMGTVGKCLVAPDGIEAGIMDSHLLRLRLAPEVIDAAFLTHVFETPIVLRQVKQLSVGGIMEGLSSKIIRGITLPVPSVPEQAAIAAVLSHMDAELAALEARRDKTRDLKQAMMQELLTGKTRLVKPGAAHA